MGLSTVRKVRLSAIHLFSAVALASPAVASAISCGSVNGRYQYCPADTSRGVQLQRQLSRSQCLQSTTWGYDRGGVWVDKGCAATFSVGDGGGVSRGVEGRGQGSQVGAAIIGGLIGTLLGAAAAHDTLRTGSAIWTTRYYSGPPNADPWWVSRRKAVSSRMDSIRAGMDPDTDVMAAQLRQNETPPATPADAAQRDQMRIEDAIAEDRARIESAGVPSRSDTDQRAEYRANQDFQREVMIRRANENADSSDSESDSDSDSDSGNSDDSAAAEETPSS